ncbi:MAG: DUF4923 family protein [Bacteroidales bacterium]|nr:DUF4923 family protein [Bacteroidales bacterium]
MKKIFIATAMIMAMMSAQTLSAQTQGTEQKTETKSILGNLLNGALSGATEAVNNSSIGQATNGLLGNLISSVTGSVTTTEATIQGNWSYSRPSVQFESENLLKNAGGTAIATKAEDKIASIYKLVGIKEGTLTFNFEKDGKLTYSMGRITRNGTWTFNDEDKSVTITTARGASYKAYATVSGNQMALTFDANKLYELMQTIGSKFKSLKSITTLMSQYSGAKVGFTLEKK